jgi:hypothetical protein
LLAFKQARDIRLELHENTRSSRKVNGFNQRWNETVLQGLAPCIGPATSAPPEQMWQSQTQVLTSCEAFFILTFNYRNDYIVAGRF